MLATAVATGVDAVDPASVTAAVAFTVAPAVAPALAVALVVTCGCRDGRFFGVGCLARYHNG